MNRINLFFILILLVLFSSCEKEEIHYLNKTSPGELISPVQLFIFNGESNSGGIAPNSDATAEELLPMPRIRIWNNYTNHFEVMQIGVNNLLGHYLDTLGLVSLESFNSGQYAATHSWELQLSNIIKDKYATKSVYLVKTGQGGSTISQWDTSGLYFHIMKNRLDSALNELHKLAKPIEVFVFYSQGINDNRIGTPEIIWQQLTIKHLQEIRNITGPSTRIVLAKQMADLGNNIYNNAIEGICALDSSGLTTFIEGDHASTLATDRNHYDYRGMKVIANRLFSSIEMYIH